MKTSHAKESLEKFLHDLNEFNENLTLAQESSEEMASFIDLHVKAFGDRITHYATDLHITRSQINTSLNISVLLLHPYHTKRLIIHIQPLSLVEFAHLRMIIFTTLTTSAK